MRDEPTTGDTRAERIKRRWDEGESERAARRAEREAARQPEREAARQPELEAVGLRRRMGYRVADLGWRLLFTLITLAVIALPAVVVWAFVDADAAAAVGGVTIAIVVGAAVVVMSAGTKYSGDW